MLTVFNKNFPAYALRNLRESLGRRGGSRHKLAGSDSLKVGKWPEYVAHVIFSPFALAGGGGGRKICFTRSVPLLGGPENYLKVRMLLSSLSLETGFSIRSTLETFNQVKSKT